MRPAFFVQEVEDHRMQRNRRSRHRHRNKIVLCDRDPGVGELIVWQPRKMVAKVLLFDKFDKRTTVPRNPACIFFRGNGNKIHEFYHGRYLLCKVRRYDISGHEKNDRKGWYVTAVWYRIQPTGYQEGHIGGVDNVELYAIVIDGKLVYRPAEYTPITLKIPELGGPVARELLCTI